MKFNKENLNPFGKKVGDCSFRALAKFLNKDWFKVYDDLCDIGRSIACPPNSDETIKLYLDKFESESCKAIKGKKRLTVKDFNKGKYFLKVANHYTCVIDGICYDIWDCRNKCVYRYWKAN